MGVYCIISTDGQKNYIVQTKNLYQLNDEKNLVPIALDEFGDEKCFVRDENIRVGNTAFQLIDSHDDPKVLKNRNKVSTRIIVSRLPKYNPKLRSKASNKVKTTSAVNAPTDLSNEIDKENTPNRRARQRRLQTPQPRRNMLIQRPYIQQVQYLTKKFDLFSKAKRVGKKKNAKTQQLLPQRNTERVTNLTETIVRENGVELRQVRKIQMDSEEYSTVSLKKSMRLRAGFITKKLWSSEERLKMYIKLLPGAVNCVRVNRQHCKQVKDICLYLQWAKEIKYLPGSEDDIDIHVREWIGQFLNEHRNQVKKNERNLPQQ